MHARALPHVCAHAPSYVPPRRSLPRQLDECRPQGRICTRDGDAHVHGHAPRRACISWANWSKPQWAIRLTQKLVSTVYVHGGGGEEDGAHAYDSAEL